LKETTLTQLENELENFKRKFAVIVHQKGLLYQEYLNEKNASETEIKKCQEQSNELKRLREQDGVRLLEYDRLLENLATDPETLKTRVGELTRKITVLRVNEKSLARRYTAMQEVESSLRRENEKLKRDIVDMEGSVMARVGYLERYKETAGYKVAVLQRSLDESCPAAELEAVNREYNELTAKYRDLLQKENVLVERSSK
jgi:centrosomal protein CEP290